jgi:hypothetical protein
VSRDFLLNFFGNRLPKGPRLNPRKYFRLRYRIRRDIRLQSLITRYAAQSGTKLFHQVAPFVKFYLVGVVMTGKSHINDFFTDCSLSHTERLQNLNNLSGAM